MNLVKLCIEAELTQQQLEVLKQIMRVAVESSESEYSKLFNRNDPDTADAKEAADDVRRIQEVLLHEKSRRS